MFLAGAVDVPGQVVVGELNEPSAAVADEVFVVFPAEDGLVVNVGVAVADFADDAGLAEQGEGAVDGAPADAVGPVGEFGCEVVGTEVVLA